MQAKTQCEEAVEGKVIGGRTYGIEKPREVAKFDISLSIGMGI